MRLTSTLIILFYLTWGAIAAEIKGRVIDAESGKPLAGANVMVEGENIGAATNAEGEFTLLNAPDNPFILSAGYIGYQVKKIKVNPWAASSFDFELKPSFVRGEDVIVTSSRADIARAPATFTNLTSQEVREIYYAQELPLLIEDTPGLFAYSDAGNPQGYTYLKIRGFDQKRVSVMINGIPLNDPEDHQVYWFDMPDLSANIDDIQVQRGLGYSPYGPSAFGGSVNIITQTAPRDKRMEAAYGYGSFDTRKFSALFNSGLVDNTYQFYGRFSRITTDGYRDGASFEGWSYYLSATRFGLNNTLQVNLYGGPLLLHPAWDATPESVLDTNRTYNYTLEHYPKTTEEFNQPHYELHHTVELSDQVTLKNTLFYIKGKGYWEIYKDWQPLFDYGLSSSPEDTADLVQQQWVDKGQWGFIPQLNWKRERFDFTAGGNFWNFHSHHYGKIIWVGGPSAEFTPKHEDHDFNGDIWEASLFAHAAYSPSDRLWLMGELQYRHLGVQFEQNRAGAFDGAELNRYELAHNFLNPKAGASYKLTDETSLYASAGLAQREPSQREYWSSIWVGPEYYGIDPLFAKSRPIMVGSDTVCTEWSDPQVEPEKMVDFEFGLKHRSPRLKGSLNLYLMDFRNEIIYGGGVANGHLIVVGNAERTLHRGVEAEAKYTPLENVELYGNAAYSLNTFESRDVRGISSAGTTIRVKRGNRIPLFPDFIARGRISVSFKPAEDITVKPSLGMSYIGKQYLESVNIESAVVDPYFKGDFRLLVALPRKAGRPGIEIHAVVDNILNTEYETSGYYYYGNYLYPGAERNYFVDLRLGL